MKRLYWIALSLAILFGAVYWLLSGPAVPTPLGLAGKALSAGKPEERVQAAVELTLIQHPQTCSQLKRLATESKDAEVVVVAINKLASSNYKEYLPVFLDTLDHEEQRVREAACAAVLMGPGRSQLDSAGYRAADPPQQRAEASQRLKDIVKDIGQNKHSEKKVVAVAAVAAEHPPSKKKDEAKESPDKDTPPPGPAPSVAPAPAPPVGAAAAAPPPQQDYPALQLLTWMCRVLAVLLLIAEVAGAFSLLLGDPGPAQARKNNHPMTPAPSVEEQVDQILARKATGLWSKIATLFGGAVCIVALLIAAEMIQLIPLAMRVEYKLDQTIRVR